MTIIDQANAIVTQLAATYADEEGTRNVFVPGQLLVNDFIWTGCDAVFVRLDSAFPSSAFPAPDAKPTGCSAPLTARWHIGASRCVAGVESDGSAPSEAEQGGDSLQLLADLVKLRTMICELVNESTHFDERSGIVLGSWQPFGPLGNVAGGYWPLTARVVRR